MSSNNPNYFLKYYTVSKEEVLRLRSYNSYKLKEFGYLATPGISQLVTRFLICGEIAIIRSCEGYHDSPRRKHRVPSISFLVTTTGLNDLLCYLERCRVELAANSDMWMVSFIHKLVGDTTIQTVTWSLSTPVNPIRKEHIINTMCSEFDLYFSDARGEVNGKKEKET